VRRDVEMAKLGEYVKNDTKKWDKNDEVTRGEKPKAPKWEYQPIKFSDPREISIPR
jgi:Asp-tRNA(Asn)/Glu-tRNA(Gln) amidotransferase B subunit